VEDARVLVAELISARPSEIVFTSGATESNNLALGGVCEHLRALGRTRILVSEGEHASVLSAASRCERNGFTVGRIPLLANGQIDLEAFSIMLDDSVGLVSCMAANHELGVIYPLEVIAALCRQAGSLLHSDLSQAAGTVRLSVECLDLASLSSHKLYGPTGIGALFVRRILRPKLQAQIVGGGQEAGARAGTVPAALCVAFGKACLLARQEIDTDAARIRSLRDKLLARLLEVPGARLNGAMTPRLPGNINIAFDGVDAEALLIAVKDSISISSGSACTSARLEPSHVLLATGLSEPEAAQAVRIGLGRWTTDEDVEMAAETLVRAVSSLRNTLRRGDA
jgi:cysteine desulfurase